MILQAAHCARVVRFEQKNGTVISTVLKQGKMSNHSLVPNNESGVCPLQQPRPKPKLQNVSISERMMAIREVYLDNASTTQCAPEVVNVVAGCMSQGLGNPHSTHIMGQRAAEAVENAKDEISRMIPGWKKHEMYFTSGATESNRLALAMGGKVVCLVTDHSSAREHADMCRVDADGIVDFVHLRQILEEGEYQCLSMCHGNNETGVLQPLERIINLRNLVAPTVSIHLDLSQSFCKMSLEELDGVDMATCNSHKIHGPVGVGLLLVREAKMQSRFRPVGTPPVALILGFAKAVSLFVEPLDVSHLKQWFETQLVALGAVSNCSFVSTLSTICNFHFPHFDASMMIAKLGQRGVMVSSGSACQLGLESFVLKAMGKNATESLRFSFGRYTTKEQLQYSIDALQDVINL